MTPQEEVELKNRISYLEKQMQKVIQHLKSQPKNSKPIWRCKYCNYTTHVRPVGTAGHCPSSPTGKHVFIKE